MGIETEYGIVQPGRPQANPMLLSSHVVAAYAALTADAAHARGGRPRWDDADEDPLADARGLRLERSSAHPSLLTDDPEHPAPAGPSAGERDGADGSEGMADLDASSMDRPTVEDYDDPGAATSILTNGARLYVDHAHPEYSSPEVTGPRDAVVWDKAGEAVMLAAVRSLGRNPAMPDVVLYKNNVDGKGASYGMHENYLVDRDLPFEDLAALLIPFLVTRAV